MAVVEGVDAGIGDKDEEWGVTVIVIEGLLGSRQ